MKLMTRGDIEGFFAFGLDAMLALLLMSSLLIGFLGFSPELVFTRIVPGSAVGLLIGNAFYAWQALKLAQIEGRDDVCAMPYGTSTLTMVIYVFLIMFPAQQKALVDGLSSEEANIIAWHVGLLACCTSGLIEFGGAFIVRRLRRIIPRVVMLVAVAGTGLVFLSMDYLVRVFATPLIGMGSLAILFVFYFGNTRPVFGVPAGLVILVFGAALAWALKFLGLTDVVPGSEIDLAYFGLNLPWPELPQVGPSLPYLFEFLPIIIPFGFVFLIASLQNIEAAAAAGDNYRARPMLMMNGVGSFGAAFFGSPFPTTIFLGHPGYKRIGARAGYSLLNGVFWTTVCISGTVTIFTYLIPIEAVMALIIWIGVVVCAQNFQLAERRHMAAIVFGLMPAFASYVALVAKHVMTTASGNESPIDFFSTQFETAVLETRGFFLDGLYAFGQGYIYSSMVLAAIVYYVTDRHFRLAAIWSLVGAGLTLIGFIHVYAYVETDVLGRIAFPLPQWNDWTTGYVMMAIIFLLAPYFSRGRADDDDPTVQEVDETMRTR